MAPTIGARRGADDTTVTDVATQFRIVTGRTCSIPSSKFIEYSYSSVIRLTSNFGHLTINFAAHSARLCKLTKQQPVIAGGPEHVVLLLMLTGPIDIFARSNDLPSWRHPFCFTCNFDHCHWSLFTQSPQHVNAVVRCAANPDPPDLHRRAD